MGISKAKVGKFVRAAAVSGLLGAAGLTFTATPAWAGGGSDTGGSDTGGSDTGGSDTAATTDDTTTDDTLADDSSLDTGTDDALAATGGEVAVPLLLGGTALTIVLVGRKFLSAPS